MSTSPEPTRVLYVAAAPDRDISTEREFKQIREILDKIPGIELHPVFCASVRDLHNELISRDVQIVHLAAHGGSEGPELETEGGPWNGDLPADMVVELLRHQQALRCVVLNACFSASWFTEPLGPALILMRGPLGDDAALAFSDGFYRSLAAGRSLPTAFQQGKLRVRMEVRDARFDPVFMPDCIGVIGVRSHKGYAEQLHDRCQFFCDLAVHFEGLAEPNWVGAVGQLQEFVARTELQDRLKDGEHFINLDCPSSIALHIGRLFGAHARVHPFQGRPARELWKPDHSLPMPAESPWITEEHRSVGAGKLVVSISLSNDTRPLVSDHLEKLGVPAHWVDFRPLDGANKYAVRTADHANALARTLAAELARLRVQHDFAEVDLFFSAPNAFMYLLGHQGASLGTLNLHERVIEPERYVASFSSK